MKLSSRILVSGMILGMGFTAQAQKVNFQEAIKTNYNAFSQESQVEQSKALQEAKDYAYYRQYPNSRIGEDFLLNCRRLGLENRFCSIALGERKIESESSPSISKKTRNSFVKALLSLDDVSSREKNCPSAVKTLKSISSEKSLSRLKARALYWQYVCASKPETKEALKEQLWKEAPLSYQSLSILTEENDPRLQELIQKQMDWPIQTRSEVNPAMNSILVGIEALLKLNEFGAAALVERNYNIEIADLEPGVQLYLAVLANQVSRAVPSTQPITRILGGLIARDPQYRTGFTLKLLYPDDYGLYLIREARQVPFRDLLDELRGQHDWALLAALIHQESALNPRAASAAKAYGLMQLLLPTAQDIYAVWPDRPMFPISRDMLFDPKINIQIGVQDFDRRYNRFGQNKALALASYNAGEAAVSDWMAKAPKTSDPQIQADVLFLNLDKDSRISEYPAMIQAKEIIYRALYPAH